MFQGPAHLGQGGAGQALPKAEGQGQGFPPRLPLPRGQARPGQELIQGKVHAVAAEGVQPPLGVQVEQGQPQGLAGAAEVPAVQP